RDRKPEIRNSKPEIRNPKSEIRNHWSGGAGSDSAFRISNLGFPNFGFALDDDLTKPAQAPDGPRSGDQPEPPVRLKKKVKPADDSDKEKKSEPSKEKTKPNEEKEEDEPVAEPDQDPKEIIGRISKNMENSKERLAQKDSGDGTQQVQRDIVADLD